MVNKNKSEWICDRCGTSEELGYNEQPPGWGGVSAAKPPRAGFSGQRLDLCERCVEDFEAFMKLESVDPPVKDESKTVGEMTPEERTEYLKGFIGKQVGIIRQTGSNLRCGVLESVGNDGVTAVVKQHNGIFYISAAVYQHQIETQTTQRSGELPPKHEIKMTTRGNG
jgi:hypothetical protein